MNKKLYLLVLGAASLALQPVNARSQFTRVSSSMFSFLIMF